MHDRHVRHGEPLTKREVEKFCMKYKKYRNEGGNGWGERLYYKILQCKTDDGEIAEEVLATLKTLKGKLARVRVVEDETSVYFELDADNDSDVIIHCFGNDDELEEYIKIRSGEVVQVGESSFA